MRYLVLLAEDPQAWDRASESERQEVHRRHVAFDRAVRERGRLLGGEALARGDTATTLRPEAGEHVVTEGTFAETSRQVAGFYLIDVDDLDVAVELCRLLPSGYTIELRPTIEVEGATGA
ncbi:MAG TPA: YciI family protein [Segeticoccus sp.]|uniref:YciI family protein n=1 Tax=Segeticoccus sp. TaxID=2706531 RepID=UPI002D8022FA|nr:YciI family protein [Segeticoccus sp.]HET8600965.1 YciI family protein [Segeticoccus sp.]